MQWSLTTDVLAWWGAIVATLVLLWDVHKWRKEGVHLSVKVEGLDSRAEGGVRWEICNRGGKATTITDVMLVTYPDNLLQRLVRAARSVRHLSDSAKMRLPSVIAPGVVWSGTYFFPRDQRLPGEEDYRDLLARGRLYYKVRFSHSDRCVRGRVSPWGLPMGWG